MHAERFDISVGAPTTYIGLTKGLLGVYNGNTSDDLLPNIANKTALHPSSNDSYIFSNFGETC